MTLQDIFNTIDAAITDNGSNAITGPILKAVLQDMATFSNDSTNGEWQDSVIQIANGEAPSFPTAGERYLINEGSGVWANKKGQIAEWHAGDSAKWVYTLPTNNMYVKIDNVGTIYYHDGAYQSNTWNWAVDFNQSNTVWSKLDKNHSSLPTDGDNQQAMQYDGGSETGLQGTPAVSSYVAVLINGQEYLVGDGTVNAACYFVPADQRNNPENHASVVRTMGETGYIQQGDVLFWNDTIAGTSLQEGWRISIFYLESTNS